MNNVQNAGGPGGPGKPHRGLHVPGAHIVLEREGLKVGELTERTGREFPTLSAARTASKGGDAIVRCSDGIVVSVR